MIVNDSTESVTYSGLERWLDERGLGAGPVVLEPLGEGHSNPTFLLVRGELRLVLRRAPDGPLAPSTHDVLREAAWMQALAPSRVPVPKVVATSADETVVGSPFFVMELLEGFVPSTEALPDEFENPLGRRAVAEGFVDALVDLHNQPIDTPELERFRRPGSYLDRQLTRFTDLWRRNQTRVIEDLDVVTDWLAVNRPTHSAEGVVHGDARPANAVFRARGDGVQLVGLLDWELAAIGDPLADVGYLLATWAEADDPDDPLLEVSRLTRKPGFPARAELASRYARRSGRAVVDLRFYEALALWKAVIVMEGNYRRYLDGTAPNPFFATYRDGLPLIAHRALELTRSD